MWKIPAFLACFGLLLGACGEAGSGALQDGGAGAESFSPPEPVGCVQDVSAGTHQFECGELGYQLTVDDSCLEQACGVILDVHGWLMVGPGEALETELDVLGAEAGYLVIHPTATLQPGRLTPEPEHSWRQEVDDPELAKLLKEVIEAFRADEDRIHITGFSQGGAMTWRMICDHPGLFASAAPAAMGTGYFTAGRDPSAGGGICKDGGMPDPALPLIYLHGTTDALAHYSTALLQRDTIIEQWTLTETSEVDSGDGYRWTRHEDGDGRLLEFVEHDYASVLGFLDGHCFPGSDSGGILACQQESPLRWGEVALEFFQAHPRGK